MFVQRRRKRTGPALGVHATRETANSARLSGYGRVDRKQCKGRIGSRVPMVHTAAQGCNSPRKICRGDAGGRHQAEPIGSTGTPEPGNSLAVDDPAGSARAANADALKRHA